MSAPGRLKRKQGLHDLSPKGRLVPPEPVENAVGGVGEAQKAQGQFARSPIGICEVRLKALKSAVSRLGAETQIHWVEGADQRFNKRKGNAIYSKTLREIVQTLSQWIRSNK